MFVFILVRQMLGTWRERNENENEECNCRKIGEMEQRRETRGEPLPRAKRF